MTIYKRYFILLYVYLSLTRANTPKVGLTKLFFPGILIMGDDISVAFFSTVNGTGEDSCSFAAGIFLFHKPSYHSIIGVEYRERICTIMKITKTLEKNVDQWIAQHQSQIVEETCQLIRYPSVAASPSTGAPFGNPCREVLEAYLEIGRKHGLTAKNHEGYMGELTLPEWPSRPASIGLLGHLDVVPAGEGWIYQAFEPTIQDGFIIGRGSQDNKGPCMAAMYALLCLRDLNLPLQYNICVLAGTNEESGMGDVTYYTAHCRVPNLVLVTDSGFPICYGERGIVSGQMLSDQTVSHQVRGIAAGKEAGILPERAEIRLEKSGTLLDKLQNASLPKNCGWREEPGEVILWAEGTGGHLAFIPNGQNAIPMLLELLLDHDLLENTSDRALFSFAAAISGSPHGEALGIDCEDELSGRMKCGCGVLKLHSGRLQMGFSARCPLSRKGEEVLARIQDCCVQNGFHVEQSRILEANYFPKESPVVRTLSQTFQRVTGLDWAPQIFEAGTHARKLPNAIAFGPGGLTGTCTPDCTFLPKGHGGAHQPDEAQSIDAMCMALKIYILGILALDGKPLGKEELQ